MSNVSETSSARTPGQWYRYGDEARPERRENTITIVDEQDVVIAHVYRQPLDPPEWAEGNANLVVAAPDLLEACEQLIDSLNRWIGIADEEDLRDYDREAIVRGMDAIQKAKGT